MLRQKDIFCPIEDARERAEEARALAETQVRIERLIALGAGDRATAYRWDMEAFDAHNGDVLDAGYYCYLTGMPYSEARAIAAIVPGSVVS